MQTDVAKVLVELREDHKNMSLLLNILEDEANRLYNREEPDYGVIGDVMQYMTVYPDAIHHPKEDRIYAELRMIRPELTIGFERINFEHRNIAEFGLKLRDDIAAIFAGSMVSRSSVVADALRYVTTLRRHMQWEERDLFKRVEEMIRDGHSHLDSAVMPGAPDPVFSDDAARKFDRLLVLVQRQHRERNAQQW